MDVGDQDSLRLLLERVQDYAIFMLDAKGVIVSWNPAAQRMKGYTAEEAVGQHFSLLYTEEDAKAGKPDLNLKIAAAEGVLKEEGRRRRKNGEIFIADIDITPLWTDEGVLRGFGKIVRDITERKEAEKRLAETAARLSISERRAWLLIDSATAYAIIGMDLDGNITEWNEGARLMFGYDRHEVPGKDIALIFVPEDRAAGAPRAEIEQALRHGTARDDRWHVRRDGSRFFGSGVVVKLRSREGQHLGYAKFVRDLTDVKVAEDELRRANEEARRQAAELRESELRLIRANQEQERFSAIVSHDLREPLRMIEGYLTLLDRRHADGLDGKGRELLAVAVDGARRAQRMITGLQDLNRVSRAQVQLRPVELDVVLADAIQSLGMAMAEAGAQVTVAPLPTVLGDRDLLTNLFQNLIGNAIKYVAPDVRPLVEVTAHDHGAHWRIAVKDNGIGIALADQDRIFRPLERLHGDGRYSGSGLGLAICATIAASMHGRIWVESTLGAGCTFHVALQKVVRG
ncbi:MAG TPA: PAS domain S-box protein [Planctomycetota bacterium]|nr:PAS domain S-box protein [Planctomycetota bacterium]